jgi:hypothetical protein
MAEKYLERALEAMRKHRDFRPAKYAAPGREYPMSTKHRHFRPAKYGHQGVRIREACQGRRALCNRAAPLCPTRDSQQSSLTCAVSTELGIGQPPGQSLRCFHLRQTDSGRADFKLQSFLSVGTKQQSRLKYSQSLMSIPFYR